MTKPRIKAKAKNMHRKKARDRRQAIAIGLSEARRKEAKVPDRARA